MKTITISDKGEKYININALNSLDPPNTLYSVDIPKDGLIVQRNSDDSFFIKNGSYIRYFKKSEILRPMLPYDNAPIDIIVDKIKSFASEDQFDLSLINKSDLTYEFSVQYDVNDRQFSSYVDIDTTDDPDLPASNQKTLPPTAWNRETRTVNLEVDGGNQLVSRQTKEYIKIPFGNTLAGLVTARLVDTEDTSIISRVGFFDNEVYANELTASNSTYNTGQGVYVGYDGDGGSNTMFIGIRSTSASNDEKIYSDDWNIDPMDGSGVSKLTLDPTEMNTLAFIFGNINGASMKIGLYKHGKLNIFHDIDSDATNFDYDCSLPIRMEIETTDTYIGINYLEHKNASVYSVEKHIEKPLIVSYQHSEDTGDLSHNDEFVIASLRLTKDFIRSKLRIIKLEIQCDSSGSPCEWILALNPHWHDACSDDDYTYVDKTNTNNGYMKHSIAQFGKGTYDVGTGVTTSLDSSYRYQDYIIAHGTCFTTNTIVDLSNNNHYLLADMHGHADVARVFLTNPSIVDPGTVTCRLTWEEYI